MTRSVHLSRGGGHDARRLPGVRLQRRIPDHTAEFWIWWRELLPVKLDGGAGRAMLAGDVLGKAGATRERDGNGQCYGEYDVMTCRPALLLLWPVRWRFVVRLMPHLCPP